MISYAQNAEDVVLARVLRGETGFYVDVGAASPDASSVTRHFYEKGWHGINVEPRRDASVLLQERRPRDLNLQVAAGAEDGEARLYLVEEDPDLSTMDEADLAFLAAQGYSYSVEKVRVRTLDSILTLAGATAIDFLKIDAEGSEAAVLEGLDLRRWRPSVVVVEAVRPWSRERTDRRWRGVLESNGYEEGLFDGINLFFAPVERSDIRAGLVPASPLDGYRTAEVVALQRELDRHRPRLVAPSAPSARPAPPAAGPAPPRRRIAVVGTPGCGNAPLAAALAKALGAEARCAAHPADVDWDRLPARVVIELSWRRTAELERRFKESGFLVVSPARDLLDLLREVFRARRGERTAPDERAGEFVRWAVSDEALELASLTAEWWSTPSTVRVRYEELRVDPEKTFARLLRRAGLPARPGLIPAPPAGAAPSDLELTPGQEDAVRRAHAGSPAPLGHPGR